MSSTDQFNIRFANANDAAFVASVYNPHVISEITTFETEVVSIHDWANRILTIRKKYPFLIAEVAGQPVGYAYATSWKSRQSYFKTVEVSVYLKDDQQGRGYGKALYLHLFGCLQSQDIHCVIAGVALPNDISEKLHTSLGFNEVGTFREVGNKFDRWVDVKYFQLILS